jgi:hypothetical protein
MCADEPTRRLLNQAVAVRFWIWDERLHTVELAPEFAALQEIARSHQTTGTQDSTEDGADELPGLASRLQGGVDGSAGTSRDSRTTGYARTTGNLCTPLRRYLKTLQPAPALATAMATGGRSTSTALGTTNPRSLAGGGGLNLVTLVGRAGVEPATDGL